ncbi:hypothetical protein [Mycobacterium palustre]|uniref:hypothetical protein n=1 Tax=Mycobacterium palustre TaxID=153971 RepID=UPI001302D6C1|nr:hypothetical protein [Mycobacterium palustre]MCV7100050.1 hypothetical protein [Mycobacterium palustre]
MTGLSERMLRAADTIEELNRRYDYSDHTPWEPTSLRNEAQVVADEEHEGQGRAAGHE